MLEFIIPEGGNEQDVLYCGRDVCEILGYSRTNDAIRKHCKKDDTSIWSSVDSLGRRNNMTFVSLSGLLDLVKSSRMPKATEFFNWVTHEVLIDIYHTGQYTSNQHNPNYHVSNPVVDAENIMEAIYGNMNETYIKDDLGETKFHFNSQQLTYDITRVVSSMLGNVCDHIDNRITNLEQNVNNQIQQMQQQLLNSSKICRW
jgi:prophage antirepressor-like protein